MRTRRHQDGSARCILLYIRFRRRGVCVHGHRIEEPCSFGALPDFDLLQRSRAVPADGGRIPRHDPAGGLCRRGRGALPLRRHDAGCGFCRAALRCAAICPADRRGRRQRAEPSRGKIDHHADPTGGGAHQYGCTRRCALYQLRLLLPARRSRAAGGHDRRHRADPASSHRHQAAGYLHAGRPRPEDRRHHGQGQAGPGHLKANGSKETEYGNRSFPLPDGQRHPLHDWRLRHLPQPEERHRHPHVDRAYPSGGQHQHGGLLGLPERYCRPGLRFVHSDRRSCRSGHRSCNTRCLLPQPRIDRRRRRYDLQGYRLSSTDRLPDRRPVRPLDRRQGVGICHHRSDDRGRHPVVDRLLHRRACPWRAGRGDQGYCLALDPVRRHRRRMGVPHRYADGRHVRRRQHGLDAGAPLFDRIHAPRSASSAFLRLSVALHLRDADAGDLR
ncbi:hypothetical protein Lal_00010685 [Lupinus albus]|nr:hypothetical protein Lal_00010685 [Lupinus albus]